MATIAAEPFELDFDPATTALMIIDMQRDFVLPGGFGEALGNDTSLLLTAVEPTGHVLAKAREIGMLVIHTREGHRPDLSDCVASYFPEFQRVGLEMIKAQGAIFGWVSDSQRILTALS
jgi:hypothetical protein